MIHKIIETYGFTWELLETLHLSFEKLFVYKIKKKHLLIQLEKKGISNLRYFSKGKRGLIYKGVYKEKKSSKKIVVAIKVQNPKSEAQNKISYEQKILKFLNKKKIGPLFLFGGKHYFVYRFAVGKFFKDYILKASSLQIKKIISDILQQCYILDTLHLNKQEMHRPLRHIIVSQNSKELVTLLDFERVTPSENPKNITQFLDYLGKISPQLSTRGFVVSPQKLREMSRRYKKKEITFSDMLKTLPQ